MVAGLHTHKHSVCVCVSTSRSVTKSCQKRCCCVQILDVFQRSASFSWILQPCSLFPQQGSILLSSPHTVVAKVLLVNISVPPLYAFKMWALSAVFSFPDFFRVRKSPLEHLSRDCRKALEENIKWAKIIPKILKRRKIETTGSQCPQSYVKHPSPPTSRFLLQITRDCYTASL